MGRGRGLHRRSTSTGSYLQHSALRSPVTPLDLGARAHQYGSWIFFRYLSERFGDEGRRHDLATGRRQPAADQWPRSSKTYSMRAIRRAVARQGADFSKVFADFVRANLKPGTGYDEGAAYPVPFSPRIALGPRGEDTGWLGTPIDHLAAAYVTFVPAEDAPPGRRLQVRIDGPPRGFSPVARVVVRLESGRSQAIPVRLSKKGNGQVRVDFGRAAVTSVDVAMINASTRYEGCLKRSTSYSCRRFPQGRRPPVQGSRQRPLTDRRPRGTAAPLTASYWSRPKRARLRRRHEMGQ